MSSNSRASSFSLLLLSLISFLASNNVVKGEPSLGFQQYLQTLPSCQRWIVEEDVPPPHKDISCNRAQQNADPRRLNRRIHNNGAKFLATVPDQKTLYCPDDAHGGAGAATSSLAFQPRSYGMSTTWIVENKSSGPVSVSWVNRKGQDVSAIHPKISPSFEDPDSVVMPGRWLAVNTFQGHVFRVHELLEENSGYSQGRVLLEHMVGLIPVGGRFHSGGDCNPLMDDDAPLVDNWEEFAQLPKPERDNLSLVPEFRRTEWQQNERCNVLYTGFINRLGCPIDLYYAGVTPLETTGANNISSLSDTTTTNHTATGTNTNTSAATAAAAVGFGKEDNSNVAVDAMMHVELPSCNEKFKMHLGVNPTPVEDFLTDWDSPLKEESTFLSHTWVARLTKHPEVVVDRITLAPTVVTDCPSGKNTPLLVASNPIRPRIQVGGGESEEEDEEELIEVDGRGGMVMVLKRVVAADASTTTTSTGASVDATTTRGESTGTKSA